MDRKSLAYLGIGLVLVKAAILSLALLDEMQIGDLPAYLSQKRVYGLIALIDAGMVLGLLTLRARSVAFIRSGLMVLALANVLIAGFALLPIRLSDGASVIAILGATWAKGILFYLCHTLSAVAYFFISSGMSRPPAQAMNGWQKHLDISFIAYGVITVVYMFDLLRLAALLAIQILLLLWLLDTCVRQPGGQALSSVTGRSVARGALGLPIGLVLLYYLSPALTHANDLGKFFTELVQISTEINVTQVEEVSGDTPDSQGVLPPGFRPGPSRIIVDDAWLLADGDWVASAGNTLYQTRDWQTWEALYTHDKPISSLHFSSDGLRGWATSDYENLLLTRDGGASWEAKNVRTLYSQLTGQSAEPGWLDNDSDIYIDPDTGIGAFTLKCRFLSTRDFGATWTVAEVNDREGNRVCVSDSPFAMSSDGKLALTKRLGVETLWQYHPTEQFWAPLCGLDAASILAEGVDPCASRNDLTAQQAAFLERNEAKYELLNTHRYPYDLFGTLSDDPFYPVEELPRAARTTGVSHYLSSHGNIALTTNRGENWQLVQSQFDFRTLIPLNGTTAYAWDREALWVTENTGQTWQRIDTQGNKVRDFLYNPADKSIWMLAADRLLRFDTTRHQLTRERTLPNHHYSSIGRNGRGDALWLLSDNDRYAQVSFDAGSSWLGIQVKPAVTEYGDIDTPSIASLYCESPSVGCYAVLDSGEVQHYQIAPQRTRLVSSSSVTLSDEIQESLSDDGPLAVVVSDEGRQIAYLLAGGNDAFVSSDGGATWSRVPFLTRDYRDEVQFSLEGETLFIKGEDSVVYSNDYGRSWNIFNPGDQWDADDLRWCSSADGHHLYIYSDTAFAYSSDAGATWKTRESPAQLPNYCGFANDTLWIKQQQLHTYQRAQG